MTERKGLFTKEQEEFVAEALDTFFKFKNALYEKFDKMIFKTLIKIADDSGIDKIGEAWKVQLIPIVDAAMAKDVELVREYAAKLLDSKIDIPKVDDEQEEFIFDAFSKFLAAAIVHFVQKKQEEKE